MLKRRGSFAIDVGRFGQKAMARQERVRRGICIRLFSAVAQDTPVDTGRLRGNWRTQVDKPNTETVVRTNLAAVIQEMEDNLGDGEGQDTRVYFANNLPYAKPIEYGHSSQAPKGMVRRNVVRFKRLVQQAKREGKL